MIDNRYFSPLTAGFGLESSAPAEFVGPRYRVMPQLVHQFPPPPYDVQNIISRGFPLRAKIERLDAFCNKYLNIVPRTIAEFRPALPYVFMGVLSYGRLLGSGSDSGTAGSDELLFLIPLERYRYIEAERRYEFLGWASVVPYIFVNDPSSVAGGREVGWPKILASLTPGTDPLAQDPRLPQHLMSLALRMPERTGLRTNDDRQTTVIEVTREAIPQIASWPPNSTLGEFLNPLSVLPGAARSLAGFLGNLSDLATFGNEGGAAERWHLREKLDYLQAVLAKGANAASFEGIGLKQFADAENPAEACYQALVTFRGQVRRINAIGLLGNVGSPPLDPSAGYRVRIHSYDSLPIVDVLGLKTEEYNTSEGNPVSVLKPDFPYWMDADLRYLGNGRLCWHTAPGTPTEDWQADSSLPAEPPPPSPWGAGSEGPSSPSARPWDAAPPSSSSSQRDPASGDPPRKVPQFDHSRESEIELVRGPYLLERQTYRVLPLLADGEQLKLWCTETLDTDSSEFEPAAPYVYLTIQTTGEAASETQSTRLLNERRVEFVIPLLWYRKGGPKQERKLMSMTLFRAFIFTDNPSSMETGRELFGFPTRLASIQTAPAPWMKTFESEPRATPLMSVVTDPTPGGTATRPDGKDLVLEVLHNPGQEEQLHAPESVVSERWDSVKNKDWLAIKHALEVRDAAVAEAVSPGDRSRALELADDLVNGRSMISYVALKQFVSNDNPAEACYQALVKTGFEVSRLWDCAWLRDDLCVRIPLLKVLPLVDVLGLETAGYQIEDGQRVDLLEPIRPFEITIDSASRPVHVVNSRAGSRTWFPDALPDQDELPLYFRDHSENEDLLDLFSLPQVIKMFVDQKEREAHGLPSAGDPISATESARAVTARGGRKSRKTSKGSSSRKSKRGR